MENKNKYQLIIDHILGELKAHLSPDLFYHSYIHTIDVMAACRNHLQFQTIADEDAELLLVAAAGHDIGYLVTYKYHEEFGVSMMEPLMKKFGFTTEEFEKVKSMIMATKVPQRPKDKLGKILADADLDYLGRTDFDSISEKLFQEFITHNIINSRSEWHDLQIAFLEQHKYHTPYAKKFRQPVKEKKIRELKSKPNSRSN